MYLPHERGSANGRFCNFMHLRHPTKSLVSSLHASQRLSRRKAAANGETAAGEDMGWTPSAAKENGFGGGSWRGGGGGDGGDSWRSRR